jgi:hypothetical protein
MLNICTSPDKAGIYFGLQNLKCVGSKMGEDKAKLTL